MTIGKIQMAETMPASKVLDGLHAVVTRYEKSVMGKTRVAEAERKAYSRILRLIADIEVVP